jgi:hypothetical protein
VRLTVPNEGALSAHWGGKWGPKDRSKAKAFAELLNAAIDEWGRQRGATVQPSDIASAMIPVLGKNYQLTQIRRDRAAQRAIFDDDFAVVVAAYCEAIPTLDRRVVFQTLYPTVAHVLRRMDGHRRRTSGPRRARTAA